MFWCEIWEWNYEQNYLFIDTFFDFLNNRIDLNQEFIKTNPNILEQMAKLKHILLVEIIVWNDSIKDSIAKSIDILFKNNNISQQNWEYNSSKKFIEIISKNENLIIDFLKILNEQIIRASKLNNHSNYTNIFDNADKIISNQKNIDESINEIYNQYWNKWVFFLFYELMAKWFDNWILLDYVNNYLEKTNGAKQNWANENDKYEYREFRNLRNLLQTKNRIEIENENEIWVVLSWWIVNCIAQLWVIKKLIERWKIIKFISWSGFWSIIATLVATNTPIEQIENDLVNWFSFEWKQYNLSWNFREDTDRWKIMSFFAFLMKKYWITSYTKFNDLKIPMILIAWRPLQDWNWEQKIQLWWNENVVQSLISSINMRKLFQIFWNEEYLWNTKIDWFEINNYSFDQIIHSSEVFEYLWVWLKNRVIIDSWMTNPAQTVTWTSDYSMWVGLIDDNCSEQKQIDYIQKAISQLNWEVFDIDSSKITWYRITYDFWNSDLNWTNNTIKNLIERWYSTNTNSYFDINYLNSLREKLKNTKDLQYNSVLDMITKLYFRQLPNETKSFFMNDIIKSKNFKQLETIFNEFKDIQSSYKFWEWKLLTKLWIQWLYQPNQEKNLYDILKTFIESKDTYKSILEKKWILNRETIKIEELILWMYDLTWLLENIKKMSSAEFSLSDRLSLKSQDWTTLSWDLVWRIDIISKINPLFGKISKKLLLSLIQLDDRLNNSSELKNLLLNSVEENNKYDKEFIDFLIDFWFKIQETLLNKYTLWNEKNIRPLFEQKPLTINEIVELFLITNWEFEFNKHNYITQSALYLKLRHLIWNRDRDIRAKYFNNPLKNIVVDWVNTNLLPEWVKKLIWDILILWAKESYEFTKEFLRETILSLDYHELALIWTASLWLIFILSKLNFIKWIFIGTISTAILFSTASILWPVLKDWIKEKYNIKNYDDLVELLKNFFEYEE